jgi:hypothetical protein
MVQAHAAGTSRGFSWIGCLAAILALSSLPAWAQTDAGKKGAVPAKKGAAPAEADEDVSEKPEGSGVVDAPMLKRKDSLELFKDPRAEKAAANTFPELPYPQQRTLTTADLSSLKNMASGLQSPDTALITRAVDIQAAAMTSRTNIKYVVDPPANVPPRYETLRAIEKASQLLVDLLVTAKEKKNEAFLAVYRPILFAKLQPLLTNHLFARMQASIILAIAATPNTIEVFTKQLKDANQVVWVKLWAARGYSYATQDGRITLDIVKGTDAAAALVNFLTKEPNAPWPVKVRVYEALGNIHLPSTTGPQGKPDVVATVVQTLGDPKERLEVRAWAAWCVGMIPVPSSQSSFNFPLVVYQVGVLAAEIGDKIGAEFDMHETSFAKQSDYARFLAGLLIYQVEPALSGESNILNSGLLKMKHNALAPAQSILKGLDEQLQGLSASSVDLLKAGGAETKNARKVVGARVASLTAFLDKNRPKDVTLYPGGPKLSIGTPAQVAGGPEPAK